MKHKPYSSKILLLSNDKNVLAQSKRDRDQPKNTYKVSLQAGSSRPSLYMEKKHWYSSKRQFEYKGLHYAFRTKSRSLELYEVITGDLKAIFDKTYSMRKIGSLSFNFLRGELEDEHDFMVFFMATVTMIILVNSRNNKSSNANASSFGSSFSSSGRYSANTMSM